MRFSPKYFHIISIMIFLISISFVFSYTYYSLKMANSDVNDVFRNDLLVLTTAGAFISAMYALLNNHLSWLTYYGASKPHALMRVTTGMAGDQVMTAIIYENRSNKDLVDMTINLSVSVGSRVFRLDHLFREKFLFPAGDSRTRTFNTYNELSSAGLNLSDLESTSKAILQLSYDQNHFGQQIKNAAEQMYIWNKDARSWQIL